MRKTNPPFPTLSRLDSLEPREQALLIDYSKILRLSRPLTETKKIYWLRRLPQLQARQKLVQHYLPLVLEMAFEQFGPDLMKRIQRGNLALAEAIRSGHLTPWDDLDYLIQGKIRGAVSGVEVALKG